MRLKYYIKEAAKRVEKVESRFYRFQSDKKSEKLIRRQLDNIPLSNGSRIYKKLDKRIGIVCDEFVYENYKESCDLVFLSPDNWQEIIPSLDAVIIASVWRGLNMEWVSSYRENSAPNKCLKQIKKRAVELNIPVAFYSKEDPPNFDVFLKLASLGDVIFTSAVECIERYKAVYPEKPCYVLPFTLNPLLHNPVGINSKCFDETALFAGSFMKKYPARVKAQKTLFDSIKKSGRKLTLIDRNYMRNNRRYFYPLRYRRDVVSNFSYKEIALIYKMFPYVINLNSVCDSATMFANRVYEASGCGAVILSNHSDGMKASFHNIVSVDSISDLSVLDDRAEVRRISRGALRDVYGMNTVYDMMSYILECLGIPAEKPKAPAVCIISDDESEKIKSAFKAQTYSDCSLVISGSGANFSRFDIVAFWNAQYDYDKFYIEDMVNAFKYTDCDYIQRASDNASEHTYADTLNDKCRALFWKDSFGMDKLFDMKNGSIKLPNGYNADVIGG